jgi:hypothetical protein
MRSGLPLPRVRPGTKANTPATAEAPRRIASIARRCCPAARCRARRTALGSVTSVKPGSSWVGLRGPDPQFLDEKCAGRDDSYAARTEFTNFSTSTLRRRLSCASDCAEARTCEDADWVSLAPRFTSVMFVATCAVPDAA